MRRRSAPIARVKRTAHIMLQKLYTKYVWPAGYFTKGALTEENILRDLKYSPYDRCVFKCDNDVVDHQSTLLLFEKGKTAVHTMTAFSREIYRDIKIYGTKAELAGVMEKNLIEIRPFGGEPFKAEVNASAAIRRRALRRRLLHDVSDLERPQRHKGKGHYLSGRVHREPSHVLRRGKKPLARRRKLQDRIRRVRKA